MRNYRSLYIYLPIFKLQLKQFTPITFLLCNKIALFSSIIIIIGDIKVKDLDGILKRGKKVSSLVTTKGYEEDPGKVEARIVHKDAARKKTVDVEDIQEIDQMNATGKGNIVNLFFVKLLYTHE